MKKIAPQRPASLSRTSSLKSHSQSDSYPGSSPASSASKDTNEAEEPPGRSPIISDAASPAVSDRIPEVRPEFGAPAPRTHRDFPESEFWRQVPAYRNVESRTFFDHTWQSRHALTSAHKLPGLLGEVLPADFYADLIQAEQQAPMSVRLSPYVLALIDWSNAAADPVRKQYLPLASEMVADHPHLRFDPLFEQEDQRAPGLVHRYPDRVLLLAQKACPVYCRFCTRSYAVGPDTARLRKVRLTPDATRWARSFAYIQAHPAIEDVVISGGDAFQLSAEELRHLGHHLLDIEHVRRLRFDTRGPAALPMKILSDHAWFRALAELVERGRRMAKEVVLHTHFNHPNEATYITRMAMNLMFEYGITVRNQSVLLRGVNDDAETMRFLLQRLSYLNVHPYYVFQHDMVPGAEDLRTPLATAIELEKQMRGTTSGFNTPAFVVDLPGGGGKRDVHSYESYNSTTGISVYRSPNVDEGRVYLYFDPIHLLSAQGQEMWAIPEMRESMVAEALAEAEVTNAQARRALLDC